MGSSKLCNTNLKDNYIGLYDDTNDVAFAFKFSDLPDWGNIGVLESRQIDGVRFQYQLADLNVNQTNSKTYQVLTMSKNSYPALQPDTLQGMFSLNPELTLFTRDFTDYIKNNDVGFIVYDRNHLDTNMLKQTPPINLLKRSIRHLQNHKINNFSIQSSMLWKQIKVKQFK